MPFRTDIVYDHVQLCIQSCGELVALLSDTVYRELKRRLILWEYLPLQRLGEESIAREFGVSRTPVRDALSRLEREGFLEHRSWAGYRARKPDLPRIEEYYEVRLLLEIATVRRLAEARPKPDLDKLVEQWSRPQNMDALYYCDLVYLDESFHETLAGLAGNLTLLSMLRSINEHIRIIRSGDFVTPKRIADTYKQHRGILLAIRRADPDQAAARMAAHIRESPAKAKRHTFTVEYPSCQHDLRWNSRLNYLLS